MTGKTSFPRPALFGFIGRSGAGKTTIIIDVIGCLRTRGYAVSAIKRAHDGLDLDRPGKDSWRMREAGCSDVMLVGDRRWALLHECRDQAESDPRELAAHMSGADIVLLEGFRQVPIPMIEVHRPSLGLPMLWPTCPGVVAVASDDHVDCPLPRLDLANPEAVSDFLLQWLRMTSAKEGG